MRIVKDTDIDFIGNRRLAITISISLIIIGLIFLFIHKGPNFGIDFKGGTLMELRFKEPVMVSDIRASLSKINLGDSEIKEFGSSREILIRTMEKEEGTEISDLIKETLKKDFPDNPFEEERLEKVGPKIGSELIRRAIWSILIAMLFILIYISWRFEFIFAIGAIIALFHDVLITLGAFFIFNKEFNLPIVAAILTIVGYSLNDTIVVYDRIRENLKVLRKEKYTYIINRSINQTLSITLITSLTTLTVVIVLFVAGGEVINNFAFALLIGIIVGTYSSIFIASPVLIEWQNWREQKKKRKTM
ncbi:protein translocase subunit SecF [candidate division KSB1 bacterium]|nr:MAG: protein translocase subunit SecF [candidate division KSB1 bacterium]